ncbi:MAG: hypothetical protein QOG89_1866 [Thermomicrobiales bacterium]|nr:hypothetical protein [Thermomicrobiales bacterium]
MVDGCRDVTAHEPRGNDADPVTGRCTGPCCSRETEECKINLEETDAWCCAKGVDQYKDGCCPVGKPHFTAAGGPGGSDIYCCPDVWNDVSECTRTPVQGRRS